MVSLPRADSSIDLLQGIVQEFHASQPGGRCVGAGGVKIENVEGNAVRIDDAGTDRLDEVRLGVVALVVEHQDFRDAWPRFLPGAAGQAVDQGLCQLRLAGPEVADDSDIELREPGVARVQE